MRFVAHAASLAVISSLCAEPRVGPPITAPPPPTGAAIEILDAAIDGNDHVQVEFRLTRDGVPLGAPDLDYLQPAWTLAAVEREPVSQALAWRSLVLNPAGEKLKALPVAGPDTPTANVLLDVTQPGAETSGHVIELGGGRFAYTFATVDAADLENIVKKNHETVRVGVFLRGGAPSPQTTSTFDFVAAAAGGGTPVPCDTVDPARCNVCHGTLRAHGGTRTGPRICVTCHTYQHADADTADPAAPMAAKPDTNPNPLDLGRLVHRIHRGKRLPTLYTANTTPIQPAATIKPSGLPVVYPFSPSSSTRNPPLLGQTFRVIGENGRDRVFGAIVSRTDNGQPAKTVVTGVTFPQDVRNCAACHDTAGAGAIVNREASRRSCQGCHPDVWFAATPVPDAVHVAHPGGPQADDTQCAGCHVAATPQQPIVWAPIQAAHFAQATTPRLDQPVVTILGVRNLLPGKNPIVDFRISDRDDFLQKLDAPSPLTDGGSPVPRKITSAAFTISGPVTTDYTTATYAGATLPLRETLVGTGQPATLPVADATGRFSYQLAAKIPDGATGTWTLAIEARRAATPALWDAAANGGVGGFNWPYSGEALSEVADTVLVDVDVATGTYPAPAGTTVASRRKIVDTQLCSRCHLRLIGHGSRTRVELCVMCHAPDRTDWGRRPKDSDGNVLLSATFDGVEERSTHYEVMIHRIHVGGREGAASQDHSRPYVIGGGGNSARFYDQGEFPNELSNCRLCHVADAYRVEAVPPDAPPTRANETPLILHAKTSAHPAEEPAIPPVQAACGGCHGNGAAEQHMQDYTVDGSEKCVGCHGDGRTRPVSKVHKIAAPG